MALIQGPRAARHCALEHTPTRYSAARLLSHARHCAERAPTRLERAPTRASESAARLLSLAVLLALVPRGGGALTLTSVAAVPRVTAGAPATLINVSWTGGVSSPGPITITTDIAPVLSQETWTSPALYAAGTSWTQAGPQAGGMVVEAGTILSNPAAPYVSFNGRGLVIGASAAATCSDWWMSSDTTWRASPNWNNAACWPSPVVYPPLPLKGSWSAQVDIIGPGPWNGNTQCSLVLFNEQTATRPPFNATNVNVNQLFILFSIDNANKPVLQNTVFGTANQLIGPGTLFDGVRFASLLLQYDAVAAVYTAYYRVPGTAATAWVFFANYTLANSAMTPSFGRIGVMGKNWSPGGKAWNCTFTNFKVQALPNAPWAPPFTFSPTVPQAYRNLAYPTTANFTVSPGDAALVGGAVAGSVVAALAPAGLYATVAVSTAADASDASAPCIAPPPAPAYTCLLAPVLGAADAELLRAHADFSALVQAPSLLFRDYTWGQKGFTECVLGRSFRNYALQQSPAALPRAWLSFSSWSALNFQNVYPGRRWADIVDAAVGSVVPFGATTPDAYDSSSGAMSFLDPLDTGFDIFVVLRPAVHAFDMVAVGRGGDPGTLSATSSPGWTLNVLPFAAGAYFSFGGLSAILPTTLVSAGATTWNAPLSTTEPTLLHASISTNASMTGLAPGARRAMMWVNGRNASSVGFAPSSNRWPLGSYRNAAAGANRDNVNTGSDIVTGVISSCNNLATGATAWWTRIGSALMNNNAAAAEPHSWRGDIFEVLIFRGSSTQPGLTEAGRAALTAALLDKYRLRCPAIAGTGAVRADARSVCGGGAVAGDACNEACPAGTVALRGTARKTCAAGAWSGPQLVCVAAPAGCAAGAAPLPAWTASCAVVGVNETWASVAAWGFAGAYAAASRADRDALFSLRAGMLVGDLAVATPDPAAPGKAISALVAGPDAWIANATAAGRALNITVSWTPSRGGSAVAWAWAGVVDHVRVRCAPAPGGAGCKLVLEAVVRGVSTALGAPGAAVVYGAPLALTASYSPASGAVAVTVNGAPALAGVAPPAPGPRGSGPRWWGRSAGSP